MPTPRPQPMFVLAARRSVAACVASLLLGACDSPEPPAERPVPDPKTVQEPVKEAKVDAAPLEPPVFDEGHYAGALFEVTCVRAKIHPSEELDRRLGDAYASYGFDESSFERAHEVMKSRKGVAEALENRMHQCTAERAKGLAPYPKPPAEPASDWVAGTFLDGNVRADRLEAVLELRVARDGTIDASIRGQHDREKFTLAFEGAVDRGGVSATGTDGATAQIRGRFRKSAIHGVVEGTISEQRLSTPFIATRQ